MNLLWSPHAKSLLTDILFTIRLELSTWDAARWKEKIDHVASQLSLLPEIGMSIPTECFNTIPANIDRLRQTFCRPYRIVYEIADGEVHVLSIRHMRMLVAEEDTHWS